MTKTYLDYAATTPVDERVFEKMKPYFTDVFGNASSAHAFGREARLAVEDAAQRLADFLGATPREIIFTSGATESNNLALRGLVKAVRTKGIEASPHIIISKIEHHCVLDTAKALVKEGLAEVDFLPVDGDGLVELEKLDKLIKKNTVLVSIMHANNEIGAIEPIKEIGELLKKKDHKIYFHTDAVQAANYLDCKVDELNLDMLTLSGHKIYGPKGVGALYARKGTPLARIQEGGMQERGLRAGTTNVFGIVGLGEAVNLIIAEGRGQNEKIKKMRDKLIDGVLAKIPEAKLNGSREKRLPNNANFSFVGAEGEAVLMALDEAGFAISTGSACASEDMEPSHVLTAIGLEPLAAHCSVRMTLGKFTTEKEIDGLLELLPEVIQKLRKISGESAKAGTKALPDDFGC